MNLSELIKLHTSRIALIPDPFSGDAEQLKAVLAENAEAAREIWSAFQSAEPNDISSDNLTYCVNLAANCCRIFICATQSTGYETIRPIYITIEKRDVCASLYDCCTALLKERNRMYIPPVIERYAPDRSRLKILIGRYVDARSAHAVKAQADSKQFNHLFGSRG